MAVSIEEAVRAWLLADPDVGPLVGGGTVDPESGRYAGEVYKGLIPENALITAPVGGVGGTSAIGMQVASSVRERSLDGVTGDVNARLMLTLEAATEIQLAALGEAVCGRPTAPKLDGLHTRRLGDGQTYVWCQACAVEDRPEDFVPLPSSSNVPRFLTHLALEISYHAP